MDIFKGIFALLRGASLSEPGVYSEIRSRYKYEIQNAILGYLVAEKTNPTKYRNDMKKVMVKAFSEAFDRGYIDAGGSVQDMSADDNAWIGHKQETESGFIVQLFDRLKEMKKEEPDEDNTGEVGKRSESFSATLDGVYAEGRLRGKTNEMLTFDGDDGQESCPECRKWKGKRHSASFWIKRGLIPGQPGNPNFSCRGYNCKHYLFNDKGEIVAGH